MPTRVMTWNLQGREGPPLAEVAAHIRSVAPDVAVLQEVQRGQAARLAGLLGWRREWRCKHWSLVVPPEGLAVLSPAPIADVDVAVLARRWAFWSWKRRIAVAVRVAGLRVVNTHLGAGIDDGERSGQAAVAAGLLAGEGVVAGDLNTDRPSPVMATFARAGLRDAWSAVTAAPGPTNWRPGPRDEPPTQRLDYVLVTPGLRVVDARLPADPVAFGHVSDHLPLVVDVEE